MTHQIPMLLCDFYKVSHKNQYPLGTENIYSTFTPRSNKNLPYISQIVSFGFQAFIKKYLLDFFNTHFFARPEAEVVAEYQAFLQETLGGSHDANHIQALHRLGYLPLEIKAIPEGEVVGVKVPLMTVENTLPEFFWLTNYIETLLSCQLWLPITSASIAHQYKRCFLQYSLQTCDNHDHLPFQAHDFAMRGMSSLESAELAGMGHLLSFLGTDTIPAIFGLKHYYPPKTAALVGTSIPATEHSVMSAHGRDELETFRYLIEDVYPNGFVSIVSDTYDFWGNIEHTLPALKNKILARDGKVVIRPDSGNPEHILCGDPNGETEAERKGLIECLWDIFGGTINRKGYKVLDPHIGAIFGDSVSYPIAERILSGLKNKKFASANIVLGVGGYTYQYHSRDSLGFAMKCTSTTCHGIEKAVFKQPKTDKSGLKTSQKGRVKVISETEYLDELTKQSDFENDRLQTIFKDGKLQQEVSLETVRERLAKTFG